MNQPLLSIRLFVSCLLLTTACQTFVATENGAEAQIPRWYLEGRSLEYPASLYLVGVGEGNNPEDAAGQARASVGAQIRVQVDSEISSITREMDSGDRNSFQTMFSSETTSRIEEHLQGLQIALQAEHGGRYYALAALDRQRYISELRSELDRLRQSYDSMISSGREHIRRGQIVPGIIALLDAQEYSSRFYSALSTHNALADRPYGSGDMLGMAGLVPEIRQALTSVRLTVVSGDSQSGAPGRQLAEPLVFRAVYSHAGSETPVPNLPVRVEYLDGTEADRVATDNEGYASVYLTALPLRGEVNQVTAEPVFTDIPSVYRNVIRNMSVRATYRISQDERIPVAVMITDAAGQRHSQSEQRIGSAVERLGYSVSDRSGVVVEGKLNQLDARNVEGIGGSHIVVRSELSLMVKQRQSDTAIGSLQGQGTGMSARSEEEALRASWNRINIDRRDLAEALSGITMEMARAGTGTSPDPVTAVPRQERPATPSGPPARGSLSKVTIDDYTFDVRSAEKKSDNRVIVEVLITNHDFRDRDMRIERGDVTMYDQLGQSTGRPVLSMGSRRVEGSWMTLNHLLISEVPVILTIEFRNVHPAAEMITLLSFRANRTDVRLRNIPLTF